MNSPKQEKSKPEKATNSSTSVSKLDRSQRDHSSTTTVMSFASTTRDSRVALKRDALNAFADACGYAANAESYELAMHAARHYWNLCMPYLSNSEQRSTLFENLQEILQALQVVHKFKPKEEVKEEEVKEEEGYYLKKVINKLKIKIIIHQERDLKLPSRCTENRD